MRMPLVLLNAVIFRVMDVMWKDARKAKHKTFQAVSWVLMLHALAPPLLRQWVTGYYDASWNGFALLGVFAAPVLNYLLVYWRRDTEADFYVLYRQPRATALMPYVLAYIVLSFGTLNYLLLSSMGK
ncbi:hypothetical protein GCM10027048_15050 [Hymenobacter coalescens]